MELNATEARIKQQNNEKYQQKRQLDVRAVPLPAYMCIDVIEQSEAGRTAQQLAALNRRREGLVEDTREEEPPNIRALEEAKADYQAEIANIEAQMNGAQEQVAEHTSKMPPLVARRDEISALVDQREQIRQNRQEVLETAVRERVQAEHNVTQYNIRINKQKKKAEDAEALATAHEEELKKAMQEAKQMCPKERADLSKQRSRKKLELAITSLEKALRDREREVGGSSEEIHAKMVAAKKAYDDNKILIDDLNHCVKVMPALRHQ